ncbi:hypothetical protein [Aporhodopirellula aestuarii]|uniref:Secreted protein n=1 Tax=Aporhodopirellula aestuarii TaxID=2950107 RepID=A0ABT0U9X9_9BACT|nr:hypothetical protein [Aporhodopirellula aestuarii]MCM2373581.1 hypothetical protein [Aporhodopirellula aestuarii]
MKSPLHTAAAAFLITISCTGIVSAGDTGWSPVVIARGEYRDQIKSLPIEQRPNRPLHFYGNSVRRKHQRDTVIPSRQTIATPTTAFGSRWRQR